MTDKSKTSREVQGTFTWNKGGGVQTPDFKTFGWQNGAWTFYASIATTHSMSHQAVQIVIPAESAETVINEELTQGFSFMYTFMQRDQIDFWPRSVTLTGRINVHINPKKGVYTATFAVNDNHVPPHQQIGIDMTGEFNLTRSGTKS